MEIKTVNLSEINENYIFDLYFSFYLNFLKYSKEEASLFAFEVFKDLMKRKETKLKSVVINNEVYGYYREIFTMIPNTNTTYICIPEVLFIKRDENINYNDIYNKIISETILIAHTCNTEVDITFLTYNITGNLTKVLRENEFEMIETINEVNQIIRSTYVKTLSRKNNFLNDDYVINH